MRHIEVGLGVWGMQSPYMRPAPVARTYREAVRHARLADELGFDSFWMGEHRVSYCGTCPSVLVAGAHLLAATERLTFGAGVLLLPIHGARRVADACAVIDAVAPGRLRLGLGLGYRESEFGAAGRQRAQRLSLYTDALEQLVGSLRGELGSTELWFTGDAKPMIQRAASVGGSILISQNMTNDDVVWIADLYKSNLRPGPQRPMISLAREVWATSPDDDGSDYARRLTAMWLHYANEWVSGAMKDDPTARHEFADRRTKDTAIIGGPDEIVDALAPAIERGVDQVILKIQFQGMDSDRIDDQMRLLATEVAPRLRELS
jgi:alkanesulfonate monooxygenase SsuD/methylene tetrahydromethanopterin reductase-like flavin-dependent oxidoreductase (luciferase family)